MEENSMNTKLIPTLKKQLKNKFLREDFVLDYVEECEFGNTYYFLLGNNKFQVRLNTFWNISISVETKRFVSKNIGYRRYYSESVSIYSPTLYRMMKRKYKEYKNKKYLNRIQNML